MSGRTKEKRIRSNADQNKCSNETGPKVRKMSELEMLACGGTGSRASKMESAHLAADSTTSAKRVKTEVGSYCSIKIEDIEGNCAVDEKEMMKLEESAPPISINKKQDPDDPEYDEELDFTYEPPPESFIQSSVCAKSVGSEKHTSSRAKGLRQALSTRRNSGVGTRSSLSCAERSEKKRASGRTFDKVESILHTEKILLSHS